MPRRPRPIRPPLWIASSRKDYAEFPPKVQEAFGFELFLAQTGQHPPSAKVLTGIGAGVVELIADYTGDTFRAVYVARFETAVYVLHSFKKKSKRGAKTPQSDIELIKRRLRDAEADYAAKRGEDSDGKKKDRRPWERSEYLRRIGPARCGLAPSEG